MDPYGRPAVSPKHLGACSILLLLSCGTLLPAQSWDALHVLKPGDRIHVLDSTGHEYKGAFTATSADAISLETGRSRVSIERPRVRRVQIPSGPRRLRNTLIGAAIGFALGLTVDQTLGVYFRNESGETAGARAITYVAPIALFGGIGAALPGRRTIYRAR